ncbi:MAG: TIGR01459 family HAD-type hydrolase [Hyphomonas sp.]
MSKLQFPAGLSAISGAYDSILCDVWGVIHNGRAAFSEACAALVAFRQQGGRVCLITNAPVPKAQVIRYFEPLGVPAEAFDDCVSSGDATRAELMLRRDQTVWRLGSDEGFEHDRYLYDGLDLTFDDSARADLLLCIGLRDQVNDRPDDYRAELQQGIDQNLPMICANPDKQVRVGGKLYWCAGALAEIYEELGGKVIYPGKPHAAIYRLAVERLGEHGTDPSRILCIGDSPATDVRGARLQGFDSLYVGTGLKQHGADFEREVIDLLGDYGEQATYAMSGLRW